jgi:ABC-type transport system substrate-binding protein
MWLFSKAGPSLAAILGLGLLLGVACGAAATATPAPAKAPQPAAAQPPVPAAPVAAPTATAVPKAAPAATPVSASAVNPGKVTWMIPNFDNERFDQAFTLRGDDYARQLHAFLISSDVKDGARVLVPGIASKWEISSDGLSWTFTIRKGVRFHDGTEVTAEDVLWSQRHIFGPQVREYANSSPSLNLSAQTDRIEQTGPDRVSVTTKTPYAGFPTDMSEATGHWAGVVYPKRATLHDLQEEAAYDRKPIGAGIVRLVKHVPADSMTFERFADYYYQPKNGFPTDKRVNFTVLDMRLVPEEATRVAALRGGDADIAPVTLAARKQVEAGGGRLVFGQEGVYFFIRQLGCWNTQFPCHDKRVRQALQYAINKELMRDKLYGGTEVMQVKGWSVVTPSTIGYSPELDPFPFDPVKARQLLAEAGYPEGKGFGKLVINTWVSPSLPLLPESAQLGAEFWRRELGLDVEVRVGDAAALNKAYVLTEDLYGQILWRDNETRIDPSAVLRSSFATPIVRGRAHNDPELFALTNNTLAVFDPVEREKAFNSTSRRMRDEASEISLGYINLPWGVGPRIRTWNPYPLSSNPSALHTITLK